MKNIFLVKFGGAVLTDKKTPCSIRHDTIVSLSKCLANFTGTLILGNGGGSFGHYFAKKYDLIHGVSDRKSIMGMCGGKVGNAYLNTILVQSLIKYNVPACSCHIESFSSNSDGNLDLCKKIVSYLNFGLLPVVYGDIIYNYTQGCRIVSTEEIFLALAHMFQEDPKQDYKIEKIIFCTDKDGVEDNYGNVVPVINKDNFNKWEFFWKDKETFDVTGGMYGKVKMAFELQCPVQIINGNYFENLKEALNGNNKIGTLIF